MEGNVWKNERDQENNKNFKNKKHDGIFYIFTICS